MVSNNILAAALPAFHDSALTFLNNLSLTDFDDTLAGFSHHYSRRFGFRSASWGHSRPASRRLRQGTRPDRSLVSETEFVLRASTATRREPS